MSSSNNSFGSRSNPGSAVDSATPSREKLQHEEMEYDRRQIRRKLREKLMERGQASQDDATLIDLEEDIDHDDVSVYDDAEVFPWKQREAAVQAAAVGGKTEGRMEGIDSLERALMAHTHKIQYGRGKGFGWSQQKKMYDDNKSTTDMMSLGRELTDWESFKKLQSSLSSSMSLTSTDPSSRGTASVSKNQNNKKKNKKKRTTYEQDDVRQTQKQRRNRRLLNSLYITIAVGALLAFAYYIESIKIQSYKTYLPAGYAAMQAEQEAKNRAEGRVDVGASHAASSNRRVSVRSGFAVRRGASASSRQNPHN